MEQINYFLSKLLSWIDNGRFFIDPMKWAYTICAYLSFCPPILVAFFIFKLSDEGFFKYMSGWEKFSAYFFCFVFFVIVIFAGILMYYFWKNRRKRIDEAVRVGDRIVTIPLSAHWYQSLGESVGIYIGIVPSIAGVLIYIWGLVTGFNYLRMFGDDAIKALFFSLIALVLFIALNAFIGYVIVSISHLFGESLRLRAQIANDVRDLGDIHRAATMPSDEIPPMQDEE